MKRILLIATIILLASAANVFAQKDSTFYNKSLKERLMFGGGLGINIGNITMIEASPMIGYYITPQIVAGVRASYQYMNIRTDSWRYSTSTYGGSAFGRYYPFEYGFAHIEYEMINTQRYDLLSSYPIDGRVNVASTFAGIGYREAMGSGWVTIMLLYNFTETPYTPYSNPLIRIGVEF